jgi:Phosphatidylserine decarboxylase
MNSFTGSIGQGHAQLLAKGACVRDALASGASECDLSTRMFGLAALCCTQGQGRVTCSNSATSCRDPSVLVQPCDCRVVTYPFVGAATRFWIKGRKFSIQRLLGPCYQDCWANCALAISRLAPQDHHWFYAPASGQILSQRVIDGDHYSVKPVRFLPHVCAFLLARYAYPLVGVVYVRMLC